MKIAHKIFLGFLSVICVSAITGLYAVYSFHNLNQITRSMLTSDFAAVQLWTSALDSFLSQVRYERQFTFLGDEEFVRLFDERADHFTDALTELRPIVSNGQAELAGKIHSLQKEYADLFHSQVNLMGKNGVATSDPVLAKRSRILIETIGERIQEMIRLNQLSMTEKMRRSDRLEKIASQMTLSILVAVLFMSVCIAFILTRVVSGPIKKLKEATDALAEGNFDYPLTIASKDEIGMLGVAFNSMSKKLKELDQLKEDFISYISHELKTPLTSLKEASHLLMDEVAGEVNEKQKRLLRVIDEDCNRLLRLTNDILDLSRMRAGKVVLSLEPCRMDELVTSSLDEVRPLAIKKNLMVELHYRENVGVILADKYRIRQALVNLLSNAIKFTGKGGTINISLGYASAQQISVSIKDSGIGILPEHLEKIFTKFYQLTLRGLPSDGAGLGLSITKQIIEVHGGLIWAESEPGKGSTFTFTLPIHGSGTICTN